MSKSIYTSGTYKKNNPDWHESDSEWKSKKILQILNKNNIHPRTICDVGCGSGGVLFELNKTLIGTKELLGIDIAEDAIKIAKKKETAKIKFLVSELPQKKYDLILAIDIIEHLENYSDFLKKIRGRSNYLVLHIPVTLHLYGLVSKNYYIEEKKRVGHIHVFNKEIILSLIEDQGFTIIDWQFTAGGIDRISGSLRSKIGRLLRKITGLLSENFSSKIFGGYSLLILVKNKLDS